MRHGDARASAPGDAIEAYLDELLTQLRLPPRETRRLLAETEDHLRESAESLAAHGRSAAAAEAEAVRRFGPASHLVAEAASARRWSPADAAAALVWAAAALGAAGLVAVGLSGAMAAVFNLVAGPRFVGALPQTYSSSLCRHFLAIHHGAHSCAQAAILENSQDAAGLRLLAGAAGLLLAVGAVWLHRRLPADHSRRQLRDGTVAVLGAVAFAAAATWLGGMSADLAVHHGSGGIGWYLSGATASALGMALALGVAWHNLHRLRPWAFLTVT